MLNRLISVIALSAITVLGAGCHNGGSGASSISYGNCASTSGGDTSFCLVNCSLGCSVGSCTVTDIAANQPIALFFSHDVDPASVNFNTVSIKTASGRAPEGRLDVKANSIEFVPEIKVIGGLTSFGFLNGETYVLNLPDASESGFVLKSVSGDSLATPLTCTLSVTRGIVDLDRSPPRATLISPKATTEGVPADSLIILEFSEIIDIAGFKGSTTHTSPVRYEIRKTMPDPNNPTKRICNPNSNTKVIEGLPIAENVSGRNLTVVTLRPAVPLPSQVCVRVTVTDQVHDLAGTAAEPQIFEFTTKILVSGTIDITESFTSDAQLDTQVSAGVWGGGKALPPQIGGSGILGTFAVEAGRLDVTSGLNNHYVWDTDTQRIDGKYTSTGQTIIVKGGLFEFSDFRLPNDTVLEFVGSNPAQIRVRGKCQIDGRIMSNGKNAAFFMSSNGAVAPTAKGQSGAAGGAGGGSGGQGGDSLLNNGGVAGNNGRAGSDVGLDAGHGYAAQAVGTGGKGSPYHPAAGKILGYCALNNNFAGFVAAGGGGGGFHTAGTIGVVTRAPCPGSKYLGSAPGSGGKIFPLVSYSPKTPGPDASLLHYAAGGSGGGGGGAHPLISRKLPIYASYWLSGMGGAGGGGSISFRVGQDFHMSSGSLIEVKGGSGYLIDGVNTIGEVGDNLFNMPSPGGGGSGGSVLVQAAKSVLMNGRIDTTGGDPGVMDNTPTRQAGLLSKARGGRGSVGFFRLETQAGLTYLQSGLTVPPAAKGNVGKLTDRESRGVSQSKFYSTRLTFPPSFVRYEIEALINGKRVLYSDDSSHKDPDFGGLASAAKPVHFRVQGAEVSPITSMPIGEPTDWRDYVYSDTSQSLNDDSATGYRFSLGYNSNGGQTTIEVLRVSVYFVE